MAITQTIILTETGKVIKTSAKVYKPVYANRYHVAIGSNFAGGERKRKAFNCRKAAFAFARAHLNGPIAVERHSEVMRAA